METINEKLGLSFPTRLSELIRAGGLEDLRSLAPRLDRLRGQGVEFGSLKVTVPCSDPPKIWCIGLNYAEHASDLDAASPEEPASFMRPANSMVGPGDTIYLPPQSGRVTGEGELAVVIGRRCKNVTAEEAAKVIAGFVPAIDMTAEDILRRNPRFLTRAKSFDTFLSVGPFLVTPDEVGTPDELREVRVSTRLNGEVRRANAVGNMRHGVYELIAFHSRVFTWEPGDILLTGTPGAVVLSKGDVVGCEVAGVGVLENPVSQTPGP